MSPAQTLLIGLVFGLIAVMSGALIFFVGAATDAKGNATKGADSMGAGCIIFIIGALVVLACVIRGGALVAHHLGLL